MRVIVYGLGAIGGAVAAALALAGQEVVGIARGAQLDAVRKRWADAQDAGGDFGCTVRLCRRSGRDRDPAR